jgi:hypothetical protein
MSDAVWIAAIATIPSFITIVLAWMNNVQGNKIHVLVNSNMTAVKADLALANEKIAGLQVLLIKKQNIISTSDKEVL